MCDERPWLLELPPWSRQRPAPQRRRIDEGIEWKGLDADEAEALSTAIQTYESMLTFLENAYGAGSVEALTDFDYENMRAGAEYALQRGMDRLSDSAAERLSPELDTLRERMVNSLVQGVDPGAEAQWLTSQYLSSFQWGDAEQPAVPYTAYEFHRLCRTEAAFARSETTRQFLQAELEADTRIADDLGIELPVHPNCNCEWTTMPGGDGQNHLVLWPQTTACDYCISLAEDNVLAVESTQKEDEPAPAPEDADEARYKALDADLQTFRGLDQKGQKEYLLSQYGLKFYEQQRMDPAIARLVGEELIKNIHRLPVDDRGNIKPSKMSVSYEKPERFSEGGKKVPNESAYAHVASGTSMELNRHWFAAGNAANTGRYLSYGVQSGFHVRGSEPLESIVTHEFAHCIEGWPDRRVGSAETQTPRKVWLQEWTKDERAECSRYAAKNDKEAWAENYTAIYWTPPEHWTPATRDLAELMRNYGFLVPKEKKE